MKKFLHADWWKNFEMVEQMERTRITQSWKNCAIQSVRLIWKQKIWLAICEFLFRDFPVNQFNFKFLHSISTFWTNFVFLHLKKFKFLYCLGLIDMLSANQHGQIFSCILLVFEKFTRAYLFQIALEIMWLPIQITHPNSGLWLVESQ